MLGLTIDVLQQGSDMRASALLECVLSAAVVFARVDASNSTGNATALAAALSSGSAANDSALRETDAQKEAQFAESTNLLSSEFKAGSKKLKTVALLEDLARGRNARLAGEALAQLSYIHTFHVAHHNLAKGLSYANQSAQAGSGRGMHLYAFFVRHGLASAKANEHIALEYEKRAAESNYLQAHMAMGFHYLAAMKNASSALLAEEYCSLSLKYYQSAAVSAIEAVQRSYCDDFLSVSAVDASDRLCDLIISKVARDSETVAYYRFEAERKDPKSLFELGRVFQMGQYGEYRNMRLAVLYFERAALLGFVPAMAELGRLCVLGHGLQVDIGRGLTLLRSAAEQGNAAAMATLAILIRKGLFTSSDKSLHLKYLRESAALGYAEAEYELGQTALFQGEVEEAMQRLRRAESSGHMRALFALGNLYYNGVLVPKSCERALLYFKKVTESGYWTDDGVKAIRRAYAGKREHIAYLHALLAASEGYVVGQFNAAWLLLRNKVKVVKSSQKRELGLRLLNDVNIQVDDKDSLLLAASIYRSGSYANRNISTAFLYYSKAVELGSAVAMSKVAAFYQNGAGVAQDEDKALAMLRRASTTLFVEVRGFRFLIAETEIILRMVQIRYALVLYMHYAFCIVFNCF